MLRVAKKVIETGRVPRIQRATIPTLKLAIGAHWSRQRGPRPTRKADYVIAVEGLLREGGEVAEDVLARILSASEFEGLLETYLSEWPSLRPAPRFEPTHTAVGMGARADAIDRASQWLRTALIMSLGGRSPPPQPSLETLAPERLEALRISARKCVPDNQEIGPFLFGPLVTRSNRFSTPIECSAGKTDELGRRDRHVLIVSELNSEYVPLQHIPRGATITLDSRPVKVPTSQACAWDVTRFTAKGSQAAPVMLGVEHVCSQTLVVVAVMETRLFEKDSPPMVVASKGLTHPFVTLSTIRHHLHGASDLITPKSTSGRISHHQVASFQAEFDGTLKHKHPAPSAAPAADEADDDVAFGGSSSIDVSLRDPVMFQPIRLPVRGQNCEHPNNFDARLFCHLKVATGPDGSQRPSLRLCPVCKKELALEDLRVDLTQLAIQKRIRDGHLDGELERDVMAELSLGDGSFGTRAWLDPAKGMPVSPEVATAIRFKDDGTWQALVASRTGELVNSDTQLRIKAEGGTADGDERNGAWDGEESVSSLGDLGLEEDEDDQSSRKRSRDMESQGTPSVSESPAKRAALSIATYRVDPVTGSRVTIDESGEEVYDLT
jgi:hypothetical protein